MKNPPRVSIIIPTYNRADVIMRAVASVKAQTFPDWELVVVDDGSTDSTISLLKNVDPRIAIIQQPNQGSAAARNAGMKAARGSFIAFLDSDDEWMPFFLELCVAFLEAHPDQRVVNTEFLEYFNESHSIRHDYTDIAVWFPQIAREIGSSLLNLPEGETDPYLRVYDSRERIGEWGKHIVARTQHRDAYLYRGHIFEHLRWGYLTALQCTVVTRKALEAVGFFDTSFRNAVDFGVVAGLCRHFQSNMISIPACIKHEFSPNETMLVEGHLAGGKNAVLLQENILRWFDRFFWNERKGDVELTRIRSYKQFFIACTALQQERRDVAMKWLVEARTTFPGFKRANTLYTLARIVPHPRLAYAIYNSVWRIVSAMGRMRRGELTVQMIVRKLVR